MPVVRFDVLWPDASIMKCQSPSTIIRNYLIEGREYSLNEFLSVAESGLMQASQRVKEKYGFSCSAAADQLDLIKAKAGNFQHNPKAAVQVVRLD